MKIGYQGVEGSNSEQAAYLIASKLNIENAEFIPLTTSDNVIGNLKRRQIDIGVVATKNSIIGTVGETFEAIKDEYLELVCTEVLPIHHSLFKRKDAPHESLKYVMSHIQALKQTRESRKEFYPILEEKQFSDTALAAKELSEKKSLSDTAVLCRKNAGELYDLELVCENLADDKNNRTEFRAFKLPSLDYTNSKEKTLTNTIKYNLVNERGIGWISQALIVLSILLAFLLAEKFQWSGWETATFVGGYLSAVILTITSPRFSKAFRYKSLVGYWKYYSISKSDQSHNEQKLDVPRIVKISEIDDELYISGFIADKETLPLFESTKTMLSPFGKCKGTLMYWYGSPVESGRNIKLDGIVELNWTTQHPENGINKMSGFYISRDGSDYGNITYLRISEKEYHIHNSHDFL